MQVIQDNFQRQLPNSDVNIYYVLRYKIPALKKNHYHQSKLLKNGTLHFKFIAKCSFSWKRFENKLSYNNVVNCIIYLLCNIIIWTRHDIPVPRATTEQLLRLFGFCIETKYCTKCSWEGDMTSIIICIESLLHIREVIYYSSLICPQKNFKSRPESSMDIFSPNVCLYIFDFQVYITTKTIKVLHDLNAWFDLLFCIWE